MNAKQNFVPMHRYACQLLTGVSRSVLLAGADHDEER